MRDEFRVTHDTKMILGVQTTVVDDKVWIDGKLAEATLDWFAQDKDGNVWYLGEYATEYDEKGSVLNHEGSWEAGVNGAQAGIVMLAHPQKGSSYRQEFAQGVAEDMAQVMSLSKQVKVPYGRFKSCLKTKEWTPLEPSISERKNYAPGVGLVLSKMVAGGNDYMELVRIVTK